MAPHTRRTFLAGTGLALAAGAGAAAVTARSGPERTDAPAPPDVEITGSTGGVGQDWAAVRGLFPLSPDWIDMSAMLLTSHPRPVAAAIERHRRALDASPILYLEENNRPLHDATRQAAARYLGGEVGEEDVALTDSTTMGVALVYQGLRLKPGQEVLTTDQDYYVTHESLRLAAAKSGAEVRRIPLYERQELAEITAEALTERIVREVRPQTRALALTWVHSSTGLKVPIAQVAEALKSVNEGRDEDDQVLLCVDGAHGFGNQDASFNDLGCDFLMAGCHKWLFGPRGTGVVVGSRRGWRAVTPTIPSFLDSDAYGRWIREEPAPPTATTAAAFTPGGFKAFEHVWALAKAFGLHEAMGRARVAERTVELASQLKEGLAGMAHVRLQTPRPAPLSAGIVAFDVEGLSPAGVVERLRQRRIIASVAPYSIPHVRLTPSVRNTPGEVETALREVSALAGA